jgi:hypothetical protein
MSDQEVALRALREVDFDWTMHLKGVWRDAIHDVSTLHREEREKIASELERLKYTSTPDSPLGMVIVGQSGAGKTHLLAAMRKYAVSHGFGFVLADMTDVRDFWDTLLRGYITSLQQVEPDRTSQLQKVIASLLAVIGSKVASPDRLAKLPLPMLIKAIKIILENLLKYDRQATTKFQDVIRAVLLLNSDQIDAFNVGDCWLQGLEIEKEDKVRFHFSRSLMDNISIVEGLSWLMSLRSPSILALDQLDSIVTQHHLAAGTGANPESDEQRISKSIMEGIGGGLMALRDKTQRTLIVASCLQVTWSILNKSVVQSFRGRFRDEMVLDRVLKKDIAEEIVASRLQPAYQRSGYTPTYPTYPFTPEFFNAAREQFPRAILQRCHKHREQCLANGAIQELSSFGINTSMPHHEAIDTSIDQEFSTLRQQLKITELLDEQYEDTGLGALLQTACHCLIQEHAIPGDVDASVEVERSRGSGYPSLHARVRLIFRNENDREKHLCLRALQRSHASAYQNRLKAAMTTSGIDRSLSFRRLLIVRTNPLPRGTVTQQLTRQFYDAGGLLRAISEDELRTIAALHQLKKKQFPNFDQWLQQHKPISQLPFLQEVVTWLFEDITTNSDNANKSNQSIVLSSPRILSLINASETYKSSIKSSSISSNSTPKLTSAELPVGTRILGQQIKEPVAIRLEDLAKHTVVLAGSGSGKTVLVRRIVEEAALMGVPAIVIDGANDLARMGDRWATPPTSWQDADLKKAELYHRNTQVLVWTPGREAGNPLSLKPLPDFAAVRNDRDEFNQAIDMARDSLQDIVALGKSATAKIKQGVLRNALEYFAQAGGSSLEEFALFLTELPAEATGGIGNAEKKAQEIADLLNAEMVNNPLLRQSGAALDPAVLFGLDRLTGKTRLSIVNFVGLPSLNAQQQFLNQLAMTLFTWIKRHPAPVDRPLRGLLIIDEAKDFVPSGSSTPCKASMIRLAAQARKYGLGLIFATQAPKSIDHNIIANCTTQFYGRANSPTAIEVIQTQLSQRGGNGQDIANLERGQFYLATEALPKPLKILAPLCLSHHPPTPLDEEEVIQRAIASRRILQTSPIS